jgi:hypothetical protein
MFSANLSLPLYMELNHFKEAQAWDIRRRDFLHKSDMYG